MVLGGGLCKEGMCRVWAASPKAGDTSSFQWLRDFCGFFLAKANGNLLMGHLS